MGPIPVCYFFWIALAVFVPLLLEIIIPRSPFELFLYDRFASMTTGPEMDPKIVIAGINEESIAGNPKHGIAGLGRFPWSRGVWARFLRAAKSDGVKLVVFDLVFADREPGDSEFAREMAKGPPVVLARELNGTIYSSQNQAVDPLPMFSGKAAAVGFVNADLSRGTVRAAPVSAVLNGQSVPSLSFAAARALDPDVRAPAEPFLLRWPHQHETNTGVNSQNIVSVSDLLSSYHTKEWLKRLQGSVIFVGATERTIESPVVTPVGVRYGVVVHASALNALLHHQIYERGSRLVNLLLVIVPALLLSLFIKKSSPLAAAAASLGWIALFAAAVLLSYSHGVAVHSANPFLSMALVYFGANVHHRLDAERRRREIARIYGKYLAPQVREELMKSAESQKGELAGAIREVTVLESDIRGFTRLSENLPAEEVVRLLNIYFTAMIPILYKHGGTWDKFVGDALLAYFGAPAEQTDQASRAVSCALQMLQETEKLKGSGKIPFEIGIGIHSGPVKVGHIGADATKVSQEQKQYTIIGDTVNLAARLCGHAEPGTVLFSETTYKMMNGQFKAEALDPIAVKGKSEPVKVFRIKHASPG